MLVAFIMAAMFFAGASAIYAGVTERFSANNVKELQNYTFFSATTTSATSTNLSDGGGYLPVVGAKKVVMYFQRGGVTNLNVGTSTFRVQGSPDGTTWYDFGNFKSATSSTQTAYPQDAQFGGQVQISKSITAGGNGTSTVPVALDLTNFSFRGIRCIVVETTDGEHTCKGSAEF